MPLGDYLVPEGATSIFRAHEGGSYFDQRFLLRIYDLDKAKGTVKFYVNFFKKDEEGNFTDELHNYPSWHFDGVVTGTGDKFTIAALLDVGDESEETPGTYNLFPTVFSGTLTASGITDLYRAQTSAGGYYAPDDVDNEKIVEELDTWLAKGFEVLKIDQATKQPESR